MSIEETEQLQELHESLLVIMREVHRICVDNNIRYTLAGGSLIGAIRNKGFIPWDDDLDIMMPYVDFERFKEIVFSQNHEWLEFNVIGKTHGCFRPIVKAYDRRTTLIQSNNSTPKGVFIDIFPFVCVGNTMLGAKFEYYLYRMFVAPLVRKTNVYGDKNPIKEFLLTVVGKVIPAKFWYGCIKFQYKRLSKSQTRYVTDLDGRPNGIVERKFTEGYELTPFEDCQFYRFTHADEYLSSVWGDYMKLPPLEKQKPRHVTYLNVNLPYREY